MKVPPITLAVGAMSKGKSPGAMSKGKSPGAMSKGKSPGAQMDKGDVKGHYSGQEGFVGDLIKLHEQQEQLSSTVSSIISKLQKQREELEQEKKSWQNAAPKLENAQSGGPIRLDVGGTIFVTTLSTLQSQQDSFFAHMFSGLWEIKKEKDGSIFIDKDPFVFRHVLNFLRDGTFDISLLDKKEIVALKKDAEFYQIHTLLGLLESSAVPQFSEQWTHMNIKLSENKMVATGQTSGQNFVDRVAALNHVLTKNSTFQCTFKLSIRSWVAVGVFAKNKINTKYSGPGRDSNNHGHGFYGVSSNGYVWTSTHAQENGRQWLPHPLNPEIRVKLQFESGKCTIRIGDQAKVFQVGDSEVVPAVLLQPSDTVEIINEDLTRP